MEHAYRNRPHHSPGRLEHSESGGGLHFESANALLLRWLAVMSRRRLWSEVREAFVLVEIG
jgi:hypothetical protein